MTTLTTVKRLVLSAIVATVASSTVAPIAYALPEIDSSFNLLEFRRREQDIREGLVVIEKEPAEKSSYEAYETETHEEPTANSSPSADETQEPLSLIERRRQLAERRNK